MLKDDSLKIDMGSCVVGMLAGLLLALAVQGCHRADPPLPGMVAPVHHIKTVGAPRYQVSPASDGGILLCDGETGDVYVFRVSDVSWVKLKPFSTARDQ